MAKHPRLRLASAALVGAILTSRSPASAISIIGEMRAKGIYTQISLGVTIFMYLISNVVFALMDSIASVIIGQTDTIAQDTVGVLISLVLSLLLGTTMGFVLYFIAGLRFRKHIKKVWPTTAALHMCARTLAPPSGSTASPPLPYRTCF